MTRQRIKNICCIGAGYVGGPTCAVIANQVPAVTCTVVDLDQRRIDAWNSPNLPFYEPKLADVVARARDGDGLDRPPNLFFTTDIDNAIAAADLIFISVNTPTKKTGEGAGRALDLAYVEVATRRIAEISISDKIVVEKSTVPCRTAESIRDVFAAVGRSGVQFDVLSNPEFLAEGTAINNLITPDRILIGSMPNEQGRVAAALLADLYAEWIPRERIVTMNLWSSELAKIAANALLAQRISSANALSAICEAVGAEIDEVTYAVGLDKRIGPHMLKSSIGFGGSCFKKDILSLVYLANSLHLPEVAAYWKSVVDINEWQKDRFAKRVITSLYNTLTNKKVAIFGFAYKKNTGDTRESPAITIVNNLVAERAKVNIYDPQAREEHIWHDLWASNDDAQALKDSVTICKDPYEACQDAQAVVIVTEWDDFRVLPGQPGGIAVGDRTGKAPNGTDALPTRKSLDASETRSSVDWHRVASVMRRPMFVFDGRNIIHAATLAELGFRVESVGNARNGGLRQI